MFFYGYVLTQLPGGRLAELFGAKWLFGGGRLRHHHMIMMIWWYLPSSTPYVPSSTSTLSLIDFPGDVSLTFPGILVTAVFTLLTPLAALQSLDHPASPPYLLYAVGHHQHHQNHHPSFTMITKALRFDQPYHQNHRHHPSFTMISFLQFGPRNESSPPSSWSFNIFQHRPLLQQKTLINFQRLLSKKFHRRFPDISTQWMLSGPYHWGARWRGDLPSHARFSCKMGPSWGEKQVVVNFTIITPIKSNHNASPEERSRLSSISRSID